MSHRVKQFYLSFIAFGILLSPTLLWAETISCSNAVQALLRNVDSVETLTLRSSSGSVIELPGHNYYKETPFQELAESILSRNASEQARLDNELTESLARREMSFSKKNPKTGNYDQIFKVPVNGALLPLNQKYFDELVSSTEPVMRGIRDLSQKVFSEKKLTAKSLGIEDLPPREREQIVKIIEESIYFEKALVAPQMKDYPFFSVVGFDATLGKVNEVLGKFFEFNSGTPSGLSNNIQLLELIRKEQPQLFEKIRAHLKKDETFKILKETIDDNALAWTGRRDGISVVIGPGVYNGAHPDVATIAYLADMPLVEARDLYVDVAGNVRLNTGKIENDPVVTGIYGRSEESFFLQDSKKGIAWKVPNYLDNPELGKKWGLDLEEGVAYNWKYDAQGDRIGVNLDESGKPQLMESYDQISADPNRPNAERGSFADAILNKKLFFSGLGGRVVDDKRLFEYVSKYIAPKHARGQKVIAGPPRTLRPEEYDAFYTNPEPWVVKAPDMSGGAGIDIMPLLSPAQRDQVVSRVRSDLASGNDRLSIQEFSKPGLLPSPQKSGAGTMEWGTRANDLRLFVFMDSKGNVRAGNQSFLLRVANAGSGSTNTSQGAGYGIAVVLDPRAGQHALKQGESVLKRPATLKPTPVSVQNNIAEFAASLNRTLDLLSPSQRALDLIEEEKLLDDLINKQRSLIDVLGPEHSEMITRIREYKEGVIKADEFYKELNTFRAKLIKAGEDKTLAYKSAPMILRRELRVQNGVQLVREFATKGKPVSRGELKSLINSEKIKNPVLVRESFDASASVLKYETRLLRSSKDVELQKRIAEVNSLGSEIRLVRSIYRGQKQWLDSPSVPYFRIDRRIDKNGKPVIGIDLTQTHALAALDHEIEHLKMWKEAKEYLVKEGRSEADAASEASDLVLSPRMRIRGERRSLDAEKLTEKTVQSRFNKGLSIRSQELTDPNYVSRELYPEVEGLKESLIRAQKDSSGAFQNEARQIFSEILQKSERLRKQAIQALQAQIASNKDARLAEILQRRLEFFQHQNALDLAMDRAVREELGHLGVLDDLIVLVKKSMQQITDGDMNVIARIEREFQAIRSQVTMQQQQ